MRLKSIIGNRVIGILAVLVLIPAAFAQAVAPKKKAPAKKSSSQAKSGARSSSLVPRRTTGATRARSTRFVAGGPWREPTFADSTLGDRVDGEDLVVRRAAVEALGPMNGTVVAVDPFTGRILTMVNQRLALKSGFQPCSTIKIVCALAGLSEGIIERNTMLRLYGRTTMNLTEAIARSNNPYFSNLGVKLGFDRVLYYAKLFGLGERASLNLEGESQGVLPADPPRFGGVGMMTSFGEGITLTALQLAALLSAVANGGTLYYLQAPLSPEETASFVPRVRRHLDIQQHIPEVKPGMMAAVEYGTARRASYDPNEPILGKTGTCTDRNSPTHLGWFGSFNEVGRNKLVVVVLLTGGKPSTGPTAAGVAGHIYRTLSQQNFFAQARLTSPVGLISTQTCCAQ